MSAALTVLKELAQAVVLKSMVPDYYDLSLVEYLLNLLAQGQGQA